MTYAALPWRYSLYIFSQHRRRTWLTLRIAAVNPPSATFWSFYNGNVLDRVGEFSSGEITNISDVFVGQLKENVDSVDSDLVIVDMVDVVIIMTY